MRASDIPMISATIPQAVSVAAVNEFELATLVMPKVAIVTGGAQGIGRAIALRLARDGVDVAVADLPTKEGALNQVVDEVEAIGQKAIAIVCDVAKESEMVANAGIHLMATLLDVSEEMFDYILSVNLKGVLYCYRSAATQMIKQGKGGRIIGASSTAGLNSSAYHGAYAVSKFGVRALTQTAALEWGQHNITVNAYAPGIIDTPIVAGLIHGPGGEKLVNSFLGNAPITRVGQSEEAAALVGFLASEGASYITGQTLNVNGGMMLT